jgi:hypothetical protein
MSAVRIAAPATGVVDGLLLLAAHRFAGARRFAARALPAGG